MQDYKCKFKLLIVSPNMLLHLKTSKRLILKKAYDIKVMLPKLCTYRDFKDNELLKLSGDENTRT